MHKSSTHVTQLCSRESKAKGSTPASTIGAETAVAASVGERTSAVLPVEPLVASPEVLHERPVLVAEEAGKLVDGVEAAADDLVTGDCGVLSSAVDGEAGEGGGVGSRAVVVGVGVVYITLRSSGGSWHRQGRWSESGHVRGGSGAGRAKEWSGPMSRSRPKSERSTRMPAYRRRGHLVGK